MKRYLAPFIAAFIFSSAAFADSNGSATGGDAATQSSLSGGMCQTAPIALANGQQASLLIDCTTHALLTYSAGGGGTVTANQGTAAPVTGGWPVIAGEPSDTTGTFTNGTQTGNVTTPAVDGYETATITISGTYSTATATFLASDDGGTTYYTLRCARTDSVAVESGYTGLTNTNRAWYCPIHSFDTIRVLSSAVASGTVNVRISISSFSTSAAVTEAISADSTVGVEGADQSTQASTSNPLPVSNAPGARTLVALDVSTVTTGGTAVTALTAGHRTAGGFLQNPPNATINLCINEIGTASGTTSAASTTCIVPGQAYYLVPAAGAVSVISSDSAHPFSGYGLN